MKTLFALTLLFGLNTAVFAGSGCGGCTKGDKTADDKGTDKTEEVSEKQS
jgi:hypothetical protein